MTMDSEMHTIVEGNKEFIKTLTAHDPHFFQHLATTQSPSIYWIGCADSRIPANKVLNLPPGSIFEQRNIAALASHKDLNCMASLEYSVEHLKVKSVIVCGHYNCGGVKASTVWEPKAPGAVNMWIMDVKAVRDKHAEELNKLTGDALLNRLAELNTYQQVLNVCTSQPVQQAWARGQKLAVYGAVYNPATGEFKPLTEAITGTHAVGEVVEKTESTDKSEAHAPTFWDSFMSHMSWSTPAKPAPKA